MSHLTTEMQKSLNTFVLTIMLFHLGTNTYMFMLIVNYYWTFFDKSNEKVCFYQFLKNNKVFR